MFGRLFHKCGVAVLLTTCVLALFHAPSASGQTPSDADTMRILNAGGLPGDTVIIEFFLRNSIVLGGYAFRVRYDPTLIEPLTDTVVFDTTPKFTTEIESIRGTCFEAYGGRVVASGVMTFAAVDFMHAPFSSDTTFYLPGRAVALRMLWRVLPGTTPQVTPIFFENDPVFPQTWNTIGDLSGVLLKRPVLIPGDFSILAPNCSWQGDVNDNGLPYEVGDVVRLISYAFAGGASPLKDPSCARVNRGDITCDGLVDVFDVVTMCDIMAGVLQPGPDRCN
ncbi:MAG: hypothetical protein HZB43_04015 [candidate division Zixibacteria bacterium]|nr:hypothetical protein [candidate division Zixibacteria bacterium]